MVEMDIDTEGRGEEEKEEEEEDVRGAANVYLNVGHAQAGDIVDFRSRDSWWLESQHGLEIALQICYGRRHVDGISGCLS